MCRLHLASWKVRSHRFLTFPSRFLPSTLLLSGCSTPGTRRFLEFPPVIVPRISFTDSKSSFIFGSESFQQVKSWVSFLHLQEGRDAESRENRRKKLESREGQVITQPTIKTIICLHLIGLIINIHDKIPKNTPISARNSGLR